MARKRLTMKQREFVNSIVKTKNATESVMQVYKPKSKEVAAVSGSRLLSKDNVALAVKEKLESVGLTDNYLDSSLKQVIEVALQQDKTAKFATALEAIKHVNQLKDRLPASKSLVASLNLNKELDTSDTQQLRTMLDKLHESNQEILSKLENS